MKTATHIVPYRNEFAGVWKGYLYPFRKYETTEEFVKDCQRGRWSDEELSKFERYADEVAEPIAVREFGR